MKFLFLLYKQIPTQSTVSKWSKGVVGWFNPIGKRNKIKFLKTNKY
jgi:hypothetical protein